MSFETIFYLQDFSYSKGRYMYMYQWQKVEQQSCIYYIPGTGRVEDRTTHKLGYNVLRQLTVIQYVTPLKQVECK